MSYWFTDSDLEELPPARPSRFKRRRVLMPLVRAIRTGFAGGHFRSRGEEFDCPPNELALAQDDAQHGWQELLAPDPATRSAHLDALRGQAEAGRASLVTLLPPTMPPTPPII
jgi:hypothetical protein